MRRIHIVKPSRRCFVIMGSGKNSDKETIYIEGGDLWASRPITSFRFLIHALSHESVHLVIQKTVPRLKVKSGIIKGLSAAEALDVLPDNVTGALPYWRG